MLNRNFLSAGYWFGGLFCIIGLLALSLGLRTLLIGARNKPVPVRLPGQSMVKLVLPGAYVLVHNPKGLSSMELQDLDELSYILLDRKTGKDLRIVKVPPSRGGFTAEGREGGPVPLAQFVVDEAGGYEILSRYPIGIEGPRVEAALFYTDPRYIWAELAVGIIVFLLFIGTGFFVIYKTHQGLSPQVPGTFPGLLKKQRPVSKDGPMG